MMHAHEKSDSAIVAGKPMNKAERSATESAEPRAETKGNADRQSTHRTQSRVSVTQALERVRKAASKSKQEKVTALFHHLSIEHLEAAFFELQEDAAAGVDGLTWRAYEANLERNLEELHGRLHRGAYRPLPYRRVYIPNPCRENGWIGSSPDTLTTTRCRPTVGRWPPSVSLSPNSGSARSGAAVRRAV